MSTTDLDTLCVQQNATILDCVALMDRYRRGIVLVLDAQRRLVGTVTDGDVRRAVLASIDLKSLITIILERKKGTAFAHPITAPSGASREDCLKLLKKHGILYLPLVDKKGAVTGFVSMEEFVPQQDLGVTAVLMAGGIGKRLQPLTNETPKPMLPVGDKPLMEIIIKQLRQAGIRQVNITTHHKTEKITEHFKDGKSFDVDLSYTHEERPLGTAGSLGLLEKTDSTLLVMNGDILTGLDFRAMVAYHKEHQADLTVAVRQYDLEVPYGVIECSDHAVTRITEKPVYSLFVNAGIYLVEPQALDFISKDGEHLDMTELIERLLQSKRKVASFPILEQWIDIGQHADYKEAQEIVKNWRETR